MPPLNALETTLFIEVHRYSTSSRLLTRMSLAKGKEDRARLGLVISLARPDESILRTMILTADSLVGGAAGSSNSVFPFGKNLGGAL